MKKYFGLGTITEVRALPDEAWEEVDCIICGKPTETALVWPDRQRGDMVRCKQCDLVYRSPRRREDNQIRHFEEEWTENYSTFKLEDYRTASMRLMVDWILQIQAGPGAILDIGSSYGTFLEQFPPNWELFGVEPSKRACKAARERLPEANIINASLGEAILPDRFFDVITVVDTIYYLPQPVRDLGRLRNLLKPGGILVVESQNFANRGKVYRWVGHCFDITWMYFYTPATLENMLKQAGMEVTARIDLPGHSIGSPDFWPRLMIRGEFEVLQAARKLTGSRLDLVPHFALASRAR